MSEIDLTDAQAIIAECRRLRTEKKISSLDVGRAAGMSSSAYRICEHLPDGVSLKRALRWLTFIQEMPEGSNYSHLLGGRARPDKAGILAPTNPAEHLEQCLRVDESRLLFLRTQAAEVERRIAQTKAALACFGETS